MKTEIVKLPILLIFCLAFFMPVESKACSCAYLGTFSEYVSNGHGVVRAKIKSFGPKLAHGESLYESMVVEIIEVIKGNYSRLNLTLLGDPGNLCRDYVDSKRFKIGSEHFIAIANEKASQPLGGCGESSVKIRENEIEGRELKETGYKTYTMNVSDFLRLIKAQ